MTVTKATGFLGISRQAFYKRQEAQFKRLQHEQKVIQFVMFERIKQPRLGTRKLKYLMEQVNLSIGRDHLFMLLRERRLLVRPKRAYHRTTQSLHRFYKHPNIIKEGIELTRPEQLWVADITYLPTYSGETYVSLVTDAYSRKIVGCHVEDNLKTKSVKQAFISALKTKRTGSALIHHSDRGIQYCSHEYQAIHKKYGIQCSMTDGYDCYQNALAERINGILKNEYLLTKPKNLEEARNMVEQSVAIYNTQRPHTALKYKTPDEIHQAF